MGMQNLETKVNSLKNEISYKQSSITKLKEEYGFQLALIMNGLMCDEMDESYLEYSRSYNDSLHFRLKLIHDKKELSKNAVGIEVEKAFKSSLLNINLNFSSYNVDHNSYNQLLTFKYLGKLSENIISKVDEVKSYVNEMCNELQPKIEQELESIDELSTNLKHVSTELKELKYHQFLRDIEVGIEFESYVYFPKTQSKDLPLRKLKVTNYSKSGKTVYFEYSRYLEGINNSKEEAMYEKLREFFDTIYESNEYKLMS